MKTDLEIQRDVMAELKWEPLLSATEIGVAVKNGVVTLSGLVDTYSKKLSAEKAAKRVAGVKAIAEDIEVKLSSIGKRTDSEIAEAVLQALKWNTAVQEEKIKIKVDDGWVTLDGNVDWEFQRNAAVNSVNNLFGVRGVANNIIVISKIDPVDIKRKIKAAFIRSANVEAEKISVEAVDKKVILSGKASSWEEKQAAERAAWLAPGVNFVQNDIDVEGEVLAF